MPKQDTILINKDNFTCIFYTDEKNPDNQVNLAQAKVQLLLNNKNRNPLHYMKDGEFTKKGQTYRFEDNFLLERKKIGDETVVLVFICDDDKKKTSKIAEYNQELTLVDNRIQNLIRVKRKYFKKNVNNGFIQALTDFFIENPNDNLIKIRKKEQQLSSEDIIYALQSENPVNILREPISENEFLIKIFYNGQLTQAHKINIENKAYTSLEIVNVDVKELYNSQKNENLNEEQNALIKHLRQFRPEVQINVEQPVKTTPINTSEGFLVNDNKIGITHGYNFIPVTNSKGETRYKTKSVKILGAGSAVTAYKNQYSLNAVNPENITMKKNPKVWKHAENDEHGKRSLQTELRFALFFQREFKPKYYLELPDGSVMLDQACFKMTLSDYLEQYELPLDTRKILAKSFLESLVVTHKKIVHRDLKPDNVFVKFDKHGKPMVIIGDFGLSIEKDKQDRRLVGTLPYFSPEILSGSEKVLTQKQDIFAAASILAEIFGADSIDLYLSDYSKFTDEMITRNRILRERYKDSISQYHQDEKIINQMRETCGDDFDDIYPLIKKMYHEASAERPAAETLLKDYKALLNASHSHCIACSIM